MIKELIRFIKKLQEQKHEVILLIDANESITDSNSLIGTLLSQTQMCDPIFNQHGSKNEPNTHIKGSKRIDYIFCTQHISKYIISSGILPFDFVTTTDHRALFIDIYLHKYLRNPTQEYQDPQTRRLLTTITKGVQKYKGYLFKYIKDNKLYERISILQTKLKDKSLTIKEMNNINNIDEMMTKGMLKAEQQIKIRGKLHPWSPTLTNAILELHIWKIIMSEIKNKTNKQTKIKMIIEKQKNTAQK